MPIHRSYPSRSLCNASASPVPVLSVSPLVSFLLFFIIASRQYSGDQAPKARLFSLFLSLSPSFSLHRFYPSLSPLAASIPGRYFGFANVHVSAKILLNPIPMWLQTGFRLTLRNRAGGGCTIAARDVVRHEPRVFIFRPPWSWSDKA